jgi:hypothetical protein
MESFNSCRRKLEWSTLWEMKRLPTEKLETLLLQSFQQITSEEFPTDGAVLEEKANMIALRLKTGILKPHLDGWTGLCITGFSDFVHHLEF